MNAAAKMANVRLMAQTCAKRDLSSTEIQPSSCQFSAECRPPVPARKAMLVRSGLSGNGWVQFHMHAPQWTHFSRSKFGTPSFPSVMAWPLHASMQIFVAAFLAQFRVEKLDVVGVTGGRLHLAAHEQRVLMRHEQLAVVGNRGPAGFLHQRAVERTVPRLAFGLKLCDFFR